MEDNIQYTLEKEAYNLHKALKSFILDGDTIIKILSNKTLKYRLELAEKYKLIFQKDLIEHIEKKTSGNFKKVLKGILMTKVDFDCFNLHSALNSVIKDNKTLIEIICTKPSKTLQKIVLRYKEIYLTDLIEEINSKAKEEISWLLIRLLISERREEVSTEEEINNVVKEIIEEGVENWKEEDSLFNRIVFKASPKEILLIHNKYYKETGIKLIEVIKKHFKDKIKLAYETIFISIVSPLNYFSEKLHESTFGLGTDDEMLIRIIVGRDEIDLPSILIAYRSLYGKELIKDIEGDTSGNYRDILIAIVEHSEEKGYIQNAMG